VAIRTAIGASRGDVVAVVLRESLVLSVLGAALGTALAITAIGFVRSTFTTLPRVNEVALDWRALVFASVTSLLAASIFGLWPSLHATRRGLSTTLATGVRGSSARHHLQRVLVSAQVALSLLLVGSAALLGRSYVNLSHTDLGFDPNGVITFHLGARWDEDRARIGDLQVRFVEGLQKMPGVEAAGFANVLPTMPATLRYQVTVDGLAGPESNGTMTVGSRMIAGSYFQALKARVVAGASCPALRYDFNAKPSAIVNKRFVDEFAGGQNLIGRSLRYTQFASSATIVGVVGDLGEDPPGSGPMPFVYTCDSAGSWPDPEYIVRTKDARGLPRAVQELARSLDAQRAVFGLKPFSNVTDAALDQPRLTAGTIGTFAAAAMALAALGLYSLFMLLVGESTREIGVRMALGATPQSMTRLVLLGAGKLLAIGLAVGLILNAGAARVIASLLFGVAPLDPLALGGAAIVLIAVSAIAVAIPAARAGRVDPIIAMRSE
jgi:predicted permease